MTKAPKKEINEIEIEERIRHYVWNHKLNSNDVINSVFLEKNTIPKTKIRRIFDRMNKTNSF